MTEPTKRTLWMACRENDNITSEQMDWLTEMYMWRERELPTNLADALEEFMISLVDASNYGLRGYDEGYGDGYERGKTDGITQTTRLTNSGKGCKN